MAQIGISKDQSLLDKFDQGNGGGSRFSTQAGNQVFAGNTTVGGFTPTGEYSEKYAGGNGEAGDGAALSHGNYEVFTRVAEQPQPPIFFD